ncbi:MAG TPA: Fe-S cluster assembly protein SufD [Stellaceae bacterium]|nr:Fe-S cluster assembly protein SufD [Stellaceae bacterium]
MNAVVDFPVKPVARDYLARFARDAGEPGWLATRRQQAMTRFAELGFPSRKSEGWRYLDLRALETRPLLPAQAAPALDEAALRERLAALSLPAAASRLVLVNGRFVPALSTIERSAGVWLGAMARAIGERPDPVRAAVDDAAAGDAAHPFAALNTAFFADGYLLDIAPGVSLELPIEIVHLGSGAGAGSFHTRSLIALGAGSRASVVETYAGEGRYWRNDVVAARLADGAELNRTVIVEEAAEAVHLAQLDVTLGAGARFTGFALLLGGETVRHEANLRLAGEGAHCRFDGAFVVADGEEANIVTAIDHAAPGGQTRELVKGVAAGRGHGAFQGRIVVREDAQKTDAHQLSRNLLIGRRAAIDTKPELEIYADDVKCSHGASVGDLDEAALFYLEARGIPPDEARHMLIDGFLREAVDTVDDLATRAHLLRRLAGRLARLEGAA